MNKQTIKFIKDYVKYTFNKHKIINKFKNNPFKLITLNLKRDTWQDGQNCWDNRKENIINFIKSEQPHILCSQEVMPHMYRYLLYELGEVYNGYYVSSFRKLVNTLGNIVLYDKHKYELVTKGKFWLSETPDKISTSWGASEPRTCVYVGLYDKQSDKTFYVFNTHLDHKSEEAAEKSISLIIKKIQEIAGDNDIYLTGDFNLLIQDMNALNEIFDSTYNYNKNFTFNSFHNKLTKTLDAIYFRFGHKFNVEIPNIKLSDHTPVIISV